VSRVNRPFRRAVIVLASAALAAGVITVSHNAVAEPFPDLPQGDVYVDEALDVVAGRSLDGSQPILIQPVFGNHGPPDLGVGAALPLAYQLSVSVPAGSGATVTFEGEGFECVDGQPSSVCLIVTDQPLLAGDTLAPGLFAVRGGQAGRVPVSYSIDSPFPDLAGTEADNGHTFPA